MIVDDAPHETTRETAHDDAPDANDMDKTIARVLRGGVAASLTVIVTGLVVALGRGQSEQLSTGLSPAEVLSGLPRLNGAALVLAGIALLVATPVMRVVVSLVAFRRAHDRRFVIITSIVLGFLALAMALGTVE